MFYSIAFIKRKFASVIGRAHFPAIPSTVITTLMFIKIITESIMKNNTIKIAGTTIKIIGTTKKIFIIEKRTVKVTKRIGIIKAMEAKKREMMKVTKMTEMANLTMFRRITGRPYLRSFAQ